MNHTATHTHACAQVLMQMYKPSEEGKIKQQAVNWDFWLYRTCTEVDGKEREEALKAWAAAPGGRLVSVLNFKNIIEFTT